MSVQNNKNMPLQKVKLNTINQYPTEKPYIALNDFYNDFKENRIFQADQNYFNKKVLSHWQPIKFTLVSPDEEEQIILPHEQILECKFRCEMLDEVLTENGLISTKFKDSSFDISLCELILSNEKGICWLNENKTVIHLQENQEGINRKKILRQFMD